MLHLSLRFPPAKILEVLSSVTTCSKSAGLRSGVIGNSYPLHSRAASAFSSFLSRLPQSRSSPQGLPAKGRSTGLTLFRLNDTRAPGPASAPAAVRSRCPQRSVEHPVACLLAGACPRLWLFGSGGAFGVFHLLDRSLRLALLHPWRGQGRRTRQGLLLVPGQRYVVSAAFYPAIIRHADGERRLRTQPQVQLTPLVWNNPSPSCKSHGRSPQRPSQNHAEVDRNFFFDPVPPLHAALWQSRSEPVNALRCALMNAPKNARH